ncbi:hypothetical protein A3B42_03590 [Candidatus Daviesbacteria bacterium RIFCSPLOWO2_01_FULL_38_10]|nr:MAG: hypothetical protein A3D02_01550 [Candidatus Daviesbacteria bacterium RIFCSPHIGHO2_02_FULL_39_41]OGE39497.1 MAG: hypothetical protein A3B42_03590 [Candidatus Daviesbacteria bacterium RIFCSPLOWO2_01_FULL_38_10]OGE45078.1 MAG: hypothetical protein A3E67_03955 [Candidatus Daviesbacteria bacterium RIFCSPHIGHO2_12_FULL_38_25]OGE68587.1 MAG: hypothetical protein A3H81_01995 [Candidatus Daviesbacteria bacterium RIFCSPLOWO2_02_FULL_38_18]OGE73151.1 MAG: hypothetical protein A3H18_03715 [Candida
MTPQQQDDKLHQTVNQNLQQMGHAPSAAPVTVDTPIPLTSDLQQIGVDAGHIIGSSFEEMTQGTTHIRETKSRNPLSLIKEKAQKLARFLKR